MASTRSRRQARPLVADDADGGARRSLAPHPAAPGKLRQVSRAAVEEQTAPGTAYIGKPMAVGSRPDRLVIVTTMRPGGGDDVVLQTQGDWIGYPLSGSAPTPPLPVLEDLRGWALRGRGQLLAQLPSGSEVPIIDVNGFVTPLGAGRWTVLVPATNS